MPFTVDVADIQLRLPERLESVLRRIDYRLSGDIKGRIHQDRHAGDDFHFLQESMHQWVLPRRHRLYPAGTVIMNDRRSELPRPGFRFHAEVHEGGRRLELEV